MKRKPVRLAKGIVRSLVVADGVLALAALGAALLLALGWVQPAVAAPLLQTDGGIQNVALGAALATGLAAIGAGIAVGIAGAAAIGAMAEKPEILGRTLIIVGLAEGIAIYGLIISFMILTR
jgi:V/A-type H+-transporting ATPase subunit K